jgi:hypothetical protein
VPGRGQQLQPAAGGKVHGLGDVEAHVEAGMVGRPENDYELLGAVLDLRNQQLGTLLLEQVGVHDEGFVAQELDAFRGVLIEIFTHLALHEGFLPGWDRVPEFGTACVQVVDSLKFEVLSMPTEKRLPASNIAKRGIDSLQLVLKPPSEHRLQGLQIPLTRTFIHK